MPVHDAFTAACLVALAWCAGTLVAAVWVAWSNDFWRVR